MLDLNFLLCLMCLFVMAETEKKTILHRFHRDGNPEGFGKSELVKKWQKIDISGNSEESDKVAENIPKEIGMIKIQVGKPETFGLLKLAADWQKSAATKRNKPEKIDQINSLSGKPEQEKLPGSWSNGQIKMIGRIPDVTLAEQRLQLKRKFTKIDKLAAENKLNENAFGQKNPHGWIIRKIYFGNIRKLNQMVKDSFKDFIKYAKLKQLNEPISPISINANKPVKINKTDPQQHTLKLDLSKCNGPNCNLKPRSKRSTSNEEDKTPEPVCFGPECDNKKLDSKEKCFGPNCNPIPDRVAKSKPQINKAEPSCYGPNCAKEQTMPERLPISALKEQSKQTCMSPNCEAESSRIMQAIQPPMSKPTPDCIGSNCIGANPKYMQPVEQSKSCYGPNCAAETARVEMRGKDPSYSKEKQLCIGAKCGNRNQGMANPMPARVMAPQPIRCIGPYCGPQPQNNPQKHIPPYPSYRNIPQQYVNLPKCIGLQCAAKAEPVRDRSTCVGLECKTQFIPPHQDKGNQNNQITHIPVQPPYDPRFQHHQEVQMPSEQHHEQGQNNHQQGLLHSYQHDQNVPIPNQQTYEQSYNHHQGLPSVLQPYKPSSIVRQPHEHLPIFQESHYEEPIPDLKTLERDAENLLKAIEGRYNDEINKLKVLDDKLRDLNLDIDKNNLNLPQVNSFADVDKVVQEKQKDNESKKKMTTKHEEPDLTANTLESKSTTEKDMLLQKIRELQERIASQKKLSTATTPINDILDINSTIDLEKANKIDVKGTQFDLLKDTTTELTPLHVTEKSSEEKLTNVLMSQEKQVKALSDKTDPDEKIIGKEEAAAIGVARDAQGMASNALPRGVQEVLPKLTKSMMIGQPSQITTSLPTS